MRRDTFVFFVVLKRVWRAILDSDNGGHCWTTNGWKLIARSQNRSPMCEIRLTKVPYVPQQVGIVNFYGVAEIKELSCRLWWMREQRNVLTSHDTVCRDCHVGCREYGSLKFGVQGVSATNWFPRVNGARDNGIRLYMVGWGPNNTCVRMKTHKQCSWMIGEWRTQ